MRTIPRELWRTGLALALAAGPLVAALPAAAQPAPAERATPFRTGRDNGATLPEPIVSEYIEIISLFRPATAERLKKLDPDAAAEALRKQVAMLEDLRQLRSGDAEMFTLRIDDLRLGAQAEELAQRLRDAEAGRDEALARELTAQARAKLDEQFEKRQTIRQREIERLQRTLDNLKKQLDERRAAKAQLIAEQLEKLKRETPEW